MPPKRRSNNEFQDCATPRLTKIRKQSQRHCQCQIQIHFFYAGGGGNKAGASSDGRVQASPHGVVGCPELLVAAAIRAIPRLRYTRVESHRDYSEVDVPTAALQQKMAAAEARRENSSKAFEEANQANPRKRPWAATVCTDERANNARLRPPITRPQSVIRIAPCWPSSGHPEET